MIEKNIPSRKASMFRKSLLLMGVLVTISAVFAGPKNVLLFTVDSCRADRLGTYGNPSRPTPNIDRWARSGIVFENAYSVSAWTAPGLVSILSGVPPSVHGVDNRDRLAPAGLKTLPRIFRDRGFAVPNLNFFTFAPYYSRLGLGEIQPTYFGRQEGEELLNWVEAHAGEKPFFLWYHTTVVHQPYDPGEAALPAPRAELMKRQGIKAAMTGAIVPLGSAHFDPQDRILLQQLYDGEMARMDRLFGQALELLRRKGVLDETLVVLTADHGEELLDHGFIGHASTSLHAKLYEEVIRIPLILAFPGVVPEGKRVETRASQVDVLPTILKLFDIPTPASVTGLDLLELAARPRFERTLVYESVIAGNQTSREREHLWVRSIRRGAVKYIEGGEKGQELFDLSQDPSESTDLTSQRPDLAVELKSELDRRLEAHRQSARRLFPTPSPRHSSQRSGSCPLIRMPTKNQKLEYEIHTGSVLLAWSGDLETDYRIEYDIGVGDHHTEGIDEVRGNYQVLGPFPKELWKNLTAWNPFKIRVSPSGDPPCWSPWVEFSF